MGYSVVYMNAYFEFFGVTSSGDGIKIQTVKDALSNNIYKYFVNRYNLRVGGIEVFKRRGRCIVLKWDMEDGGVITRYVEMNKFIRNKRDWWVNVTRKSCKKRGDIKNYDLLLNGRKEDIILPDRCPMDDNIVLNYTAIDFTGGNQNIFECKKKSKSHITWSMASIDRVDSTKPYSYDNIEVVSKYYNTLKGCASFEQLSKLYHYQLKQRSII